MGKKQTKEERIKYLETEIAHGRYWDGWSLQGMIAELTSGAITVRGITKLVDGIAFSTSDDNANADHYGFIVIEGGTFRISDTSSATKTCDGIRNIGGTLSG